MRPCPTAPGRSLLVAARCYGITHADPAAPLSVAACRSTHTDKDDGDCHPDSASNLWVSYLRKDAERINGCPLSAPDNRVRALVKGP
jgi:hypothetical protein